jgi:integrase
LNVTKIGKFMPEQVKVKKDRSYTHQEILKLLQIADDRIKVVILLMCSGGLRIGAIPDLKIRSLEKLDNIYKITVYERHKEEYFSFTTPECTKSIDAYLEARKRYGEQITGDSYLVREQFDTRDIGIPRKVKKQTLMKKLVDISERVGIRIRGKSCVVRHEVAVDHGFRKFFTYFIFLFSN